MSTRNFRQLLESRWGNGCFVCVGLDSDYGKIPASVREDAASVEDAIVAFNQTIVDVTNDIVGGFKPSSAFYEARGYKGIRALRRTVEYIHDIAPGVPVILDAKRADIGNTNEGYVTAVFDWLQMDAVTVHPYLGAEALRPFLALTDAGIIVLCRTSNPGAGEFQDRIVSITDEEAEKWGLSKGTTMPLYQLVAWRVSREWNKNGNCAVVVGATYPDPELREVRRIVGDMPILIPGIGAQGGDLEKTVAAGRDSRGQGMIINAARSVIFASPGADFAQAARLEALTLNNGIKAALARAA